MTTKELLAKAKAVGGWYIRGDGRIRTRGQKNRVRVHCCPVEVAVGRVDFHNPVHLKIADAADGVYLHDAGLRREMESWCK